MTRRIRRGTVISAASVLSGVLMLTATAPAAGQEVGTKFIGGQHTVDEMCAAANGLVLAGNTVSGVPASPSASPAAGADIVGIIQVDAALLHEVCELAGVTAASSPVADASPATESLGHSPAPSAS